MPSEIETLRERLDKGAELGQPATEQETIQFETRYGITFPSDVREYFLKINGIDSGGFVALEPLNNWKLLIEDEDFAAYDLRKILDDADHYFRFGTYDISVWSWAIKLRPDPMAETPIVVVYQAATKVADSFTAFLRQFIMDSAESLLGP